MPHVFFVVLSTGVNRLLRLLIFILTRADFITAQALGFRFISFFLKKRGQTNVLYLSQSCMSLPEVVFLRFLVLRFLSRDSRLFLVAIEAIAIFLTAPSQHRVRAEQTFRFYPGHRKW